MFNGQSYTVGLPVNVDAEFTTLKIGYEYDFLYHDRGYLGFVIDTKVTRARIDFDSPINAEFAEATAPIPTVGLAGRGYVARNVAVGGEFTFFQIPGGEDRDYDGSYFDYDVYGTLNFTKNVGVTGGWRKLDLDYTVEARLRLARPGAAATSWASSGSGSAWPPAPATPARLRSVLQSIAIHTPSRRKSRLRRSPSKGRTPRAASIAIGVARPAGGTSTRTSSPGARSSVRRQAPAVSSMRLAIGALRTKTPIGPDVSPTTTRDRPGRTQKPGASG